MKKCSKLTIINDEIVPWLAASGELAYSPHNPPDNDKYFQYSWIIPEIFNSTVNKRIHFWFGNPYKEDSDVAFLFSFWNSARKGKYTEIFRSNGKVALDSITAPIPVYRHSALPPSTSDNIILMQHGSYLIIDADSHPEIEQGEIFLYRGIQSTTTFNKYIIQNPNIKSRFVALHRETLSNSITSFNTTHCNISRCEMGFLNDKDFSLNKYAEKAGLSVADSRIESIIYSGFTLNKWYGTRKFGPNYVKFRTDINNIRITTFFCNEEEVKVIDPNKLEIVEASGCCVDELEL